MKIGNLNFNSKVDFYNWVNSKKILENSQIDWEKLWENLQEFYKLSQKENMTIVSKNRDGKLVLKKGTLIHGIRKYDEDVIRSIAENGIISDDLLLTGKNLSMAKCELCAFESEKDQTMQEFYESYNTSVMDERSSIGEVGFYRSDRDTKETVYLRRESGYLPREEKYWSKDGNSVNSLAFIVEPTDELSKILSQKKKLPQFARGYSLPLGVPSNYISGILISKELENNVQVIEFLKSQFKDKYIVRTDGTFIYEPEKKKEEIVNVEENVEREDMSLRETYERYGISDDEEKENMSLSEAYEKYGILNDDSEFDREFKEKIDNFLRDNEELSPEVVSDFIDEIINNALDKMSEEIETTTSKQRLENLKRRIDTIKKNTGFQVQTLGRGDELQKIYAKIATLSGNISAIEKSFSEEKQKSVMEVDTASVIDGQDVYSKEILNRLGYQSLKSDEYGRIVVARNNNLLEKYKNVRLSKDDKDDKDADFNDIIESVDLSKYSMKDTSEEIILKYIEDLKEVERKRGLTDEQIIAKYTNGYCADLEEAVHNLLAMQNKGVITKKISCKIPENELGRRESPHYLVGIHQGNEDISYYDILGKHSESDLREFSEHFYIDNPQYTQMMPQMTEYQKDSEIPLLIVNRIYEEISKKVEIEETLTSEDKEIIDDNIIGRVASEKEEISSDNTINSIIASVRQKDEKTSKVSENSISKSVKQLGIETRAEQSEIITIDETLNVEKNEMQKQQQRINNDYSIGM